MIFLFLVHNRKVAIKYCKYLNLKFVKEFNKTFLMFAILLFLGIYTLCYGIKVYNLNLISQYGFVFFGYIALYLITNIYHKYAYWSLSILTIIAFFITAYGIPKYYISSVSVNELFFMMGFFFVFVFKFSKKNLAFNFISGLFVY